MKNEKTVLERVTEYFGNAYKASEALNIKHQQYYQWKRAGFIPFKRGYDIERVTNGNIKAVEVWEEAGKSI